MPNLPDEQDIGSTQNSLVAKPFRHFVSGWMLDVLGKSISVSDIVTVAQPLDNDAAAGLIAARARQFGRILADDATIHISDLFTLRPVPRPPESDHRPLLYWQVTVDFDCSDVKYAGIATGVFAWPDEPKGATLSPIVGLLVGDALADRGGPNGENYSEVRSVKVIPSAQAPTSYI